MCRRTAYLQSPTASSLRARGNRLPRPFSRTAGRATNARAATDPARLPSLLKHLDVLEDARLIRREKRGRTVHVHLDAEPMAQAMTWLRGYEAFWAASLDRLGAHAKAMEQRKRSRG